MIQNRNRKTARKKDTRKTDQKHVFVKKAPKPKIRLDYSFPMRINKYLSYVGISSRKEADSLIERKEVLVNGKVATIGMKVLKTDDVALRQSTKTNHKYFAYYKPIGIVTVLAQEGEKEIKDSVTFPVPVFPVGRLDKDSEGLIVMTNDGRVTKHLLDSKERHEKEYRVRLNRFVENTFLLKIKQGLQAGEFKTLPAKVRKVDDKIVDIVLVEGQNRQIRRMALSLGYEVISLQRFRIENILLGKMKPNEFREIEGKELEEFLEKLSIKKTST